MDILRFLGNILWHFPFLGFVNAFVVYLCGLLLTLTVVASPIGLGLMEYGKFLFVPYSRAMVRRSDLPPPQNRLWQAYATVIRILYFPLGLLLSLIALFQALGLILSVVGIPVGLVVLKSLGTYFNPVGKRCVPQVVADEISRRRARDEIKRHLD
jgi:uncharacterized membrane protein YccF (DUF307 family)